ncbi:hypothetical protein [Microbacterium thalassium]|uniref:Uncharacterized protein n=1 Tax=Microbacterium thalassium TaxID=362649 RepID=A0A7X0FNF4_9MICO|nr:hypothetical protein [Microbacterium thalassium]MBB6390202.1 hypothetical protein [Microbacterium thalassium]GLK25310.1 hypothetical protein GCM10017607_26290 [Microbacterium thalassium]
MDLDAWQPILIALAVPTLSLLTAILTKDRDPAIYRRLRHSSAALKDAPEGSAARSELDLLVVAQAAKLRSREESRPRQIKWWDLFFAIAVFLVFAAVMWGMIAWTLATWGTPWAWLTTPATVVIGAVGIFFSSAFFGGVTTPREDPRARKTSAQP